jgi:hypothetical protein
MKTDSPLPRRDQERMHIQQQTADLRPPRMFNRRDFLRGTAAGAAVAFLPPAVAWAAPAGLVRIEEPFHGAILSHQHGKVADGGLAIRVTGKAPASDQVTVNGRPARQDGNQFIAEVVLRQKVTEIVAASGPASARAENRVRVVWDRNSRPRYHFALDDNIYFLRDIARKRYDSLFDSPYLRLLRDLNQKYGTRFSVNIYFEAEDGFKLTEMPDRYQSQWKDNAHWLKLAFHAYANKPDRPYQDASAEKLIADYDKVAEQIHRFAGAETFAPPTNLHWSMARPDGLQALARRGVRCLSGYFRKDNGGWDINYGIDDRRSEYLSRHDLLMDFETGIIFFRDAIVCNSVAPDQIAPTLDPLAAGPERRETINLLCHEQYFWPFYTDYEPDYAQRIETAIRWTTDHGYKPAFFHEGILGSPG